MVIKKQQQVIQDSIKTFQAEHYQTMKEVGNIISQDNTIDILSYLSYEPMRYKKLQDLTRCKDNTLTRRLHKLLEYNLIERLDVVDNNKKTHEYVITELGQELIKFFRNYEQRRNQIKEKRLGE